MAERVSEISLPDAEGQESLLALLHQLLLAQPEGIREYDLLLRLRELELPVFSEGAFSDSLVLFRCHFLLFHLLYLLRERLVRQEAGILEIHFTLIVLRPWQGRGENLPGPVDRLGEYYLDLANLEGMARADVEELIDRFWLEYGRYLHKPECYAVLGLGENASPAEVKRRYRELAFQHHPDQGGDPEEFRRLQEAAEQLLP